ncbi:MAG: hypothetical protein ACTSX0_08180 [Promethearchaeota archaeon]
MCSSTLFNLTQLEDPSNKKLYQFLDYLARILKATKAPYVRDLVALDYLTTTLKMDYKTAKIFMEKLHESKIIQYDQHGAFPGCFVTAKGTQILNDLHKIFGELKSLYENQPKSPSKPFIVGKTQESSDMESLQNTLSLEPYSEELIYRFLRYHLEVIRHSSVPYLRDLVAESYLKDNEHMSYQQVADFLEWLVDQGILAYNQFGAFPGTTVTDRGKELFHQISKKSS